MILSINQLFCQYGRPLFLDDHFPRLYEFYNVFYESKDLQFYRPYAFSDAGSHCWKEYLGHLDPSHGYPSLDQLFLILPVQAGGFNPLGILLGIFCALILLAVLFFSDDHPLPFDH